jgi:hypothetical protein
LVEIAKRQQAVLRLPGEFDHPIIIRFYWKLCQKDSWRGASANDRHASDTPWRNESIDRTPNVDDVGDEDVSSHLEPTHIDWRARATPIDQRATRGEGRGALFGYHRVGSVVDSARKPLHR